MKLFFDTEFIEDGRVIWLLSIGIVREDGEEFYAEVEGVDHSLANPWVRENVLPHLGGRQWELPRSYIRDAIVAMAGPSPEWWAYYADYDWVALCQLFGTMIELPVSWPMYCRDLKQLADMQHPGVNLKQLVPTPKKAHHALADARWVRDVYTRLETLRAS